MPRRFDGLLRENSPRRGRNRPPRVETVMALHGVDDDGCGTAGLQCSSHLLAIFHFRPRRHQPSNHDNRTNESGGSWRALEDQGEKLLEPLVESLTAHCLAREESSRTIVAPGTSTRSSLTATIVLRSPSRTKEIIVGIRSSLSLDVAMTSFCIKAQCQPRSEASQPEVEIVNRAHK